MQLPVWSECSDAGAETKQGKAKDNKDERIEKYSQTTKKIRDRLVASLNHL
jgi:hypothetical protein